MALDVAQFKQNQRKMWSAGDYPDLARTVEPTAEALVGHCDIGPGQDVLDVATGSGNAAIVAAQAGAKVTGLDLTPELFDAARRRMAEAGVEIELIEGDAEELPFPDSSFDRVLSVFGTMFAPRHEQAAAELVRVCRPGGLVGVAAWTPEGLMGRMFRITAAQLPALPPDLKPPTLWGTEDHIRALFAASGAELEFERRSVTIVHDSPDAWVSYYERVLGPTIMAKNALEPEGNWEGVRAELVDLFESHNQATDGTMRIEPEYLISVARLPG
jgi:ubiquinone/menaquinone biosynthesis C-methylase UbiE